MSIWRYDDTSNSSPEGDLKSFDNYHNRFICNYCKSAMYRLNTYSIDSQLESDNDQDHIQVDVCQICGWWVVSRVYSEIGSADQTDYLYRAMGTLCNLKMNDISLPSDELERYLIAKYDKRFEVHPKKFEEIVGSVFSGLGYKVRVTSYSKDGGIDIIMMEDSSSSLIGVQVKRYKDKIEVSQIRELVGALMLSKMTKGIFVTTSSYTRDSIDAAGNCRSTLLGNPIELIDSDRFYDALRLSQRPMYNSADDTDAPFYHLIKSPGIIPSVNNEHTVFD